MFRNIVIGVNGDANARDAIALAKQLARPDTRLTLAHVHISQIAPFDPVERDLANSMLERERDAAHLDARLTMIAAPSVGHGLHLIAEADAADLIVVGSTSRGVAGRVLIADDTRESLNGSGCPVAIAPHQYAIHTRKIAKIGVGYNFSHESPFALDIARRLAAENGAEVHALYVAGTPAFAYGAAAAAASQIFESTIEVAQRRIAAVSDDIVAKAACGVTGEELAKFGDDVDVLVVGSRGNGPLRRLLLGSTSDYLARHSRCPLLVIPRQAITAATPAAGIRPAGTPVTA